MDEEELKRKMDEVAKLLRERDEKAAKEAEHSWRERMSRDTAGTVLEMFRYIEARLNDLQAQIHTAHPEMAAIRDIYARLAALAQRGGG